MDQRRSNSPAHRSQVDQVSSFSDKNDDHRKQDHKTQGPPSLASVEAAWATGLVSLNAAWATGLVLLNACLVSLNAGWASAMRNIKNSQAMASLEARWITFRNGKNTRAMLTSLEAGCAASVTSLKSHWAAAIRNDKTAIPLRALKDGWAATSSSEKAIHCIGIMGALLLLFTSYTSITSSSSTSSPSHLVHVQDSVDEIFHSTSIPVTVATAAAATGLDQSTHLGAAAVIDTQPFVLADKDADASLSSQTQNDLRSQTPEPPAQYSECAFLKMDINDLPVQYKQQYMSVRDFKTTPQGAMTMFSATPSSESACVNNPLMQRLTTRVNNTPFKSLMDPLLISKIDNLSKFKNAVQLPQCESETAKTGTVSELKDDPLWVISAAQQTTTTTTLSEVNFKQAGFKPELTIAVNSQEVSKGCQGGALSNGDLGMRLSFRQLLLRALHEGHTRVIIVDDKVVLMDNFSSALDKQLRTHKCGGYMFDDSTGGVLLLGANEYGGVAMINGGIDFHRDKCYNVNGRTYGTYASVYHRNVFLPILAWLDAPEFEASPIDDINKHLALRGFIVRVLRPMAALADVIQVSSSTTPLTRTHADKLDTAFLISRSCLMHWNLQSFEHYRTVLESRHLFDFTRRNYCHRTRETASNYRNMHNAVVLIHVKSSLSSLTSLASMLVARWQAKLDGRYEGFIARPFIVIEAPPGMPPMETNDILSVVLGMRTQSFNGHQQRVEQALNLVSDSSNKLSSSQDTSAYVATAVVHKLVKEAFAPVLVLDNTQLEELKRALFAKPIAQMYIEMRTSTAWVPTDTQMIELLKTTKPRGRHWFMLDIDASGFVDEDVEALLPEPEIQ